VWGQETKWEFPTLQKKEFSFSYSPFQSLCMARISWLNDRFTRLEFLKVFEHLRFIPKQIDPREFTIIINKTNIVFLPTKRINGRTPHIWKNKF
jgi:hypothetical protein